MRAMHRFDAEPVLSLNQRVVVAWPDQQLGAWDA
jgi:hypothetical protein